MPESAGSGLRPAHDRTPRAQPSSPRLRIVPDVPMTRSKPAATISVDVAIDLPSPMNCTSLRSSRAAERIGGDEPFRQPDDPDLEAAARAARCAAAPQRDLDAAAADVDDDGRPVRRVHAVHGGEMDQPCFLGAGDHARRGCRSRARCAARNSGPFSASRVALVAAARISSTRATRRCGGTWRAPAARRVMAASVRLASVEAAGAEAHHLLFAVDHLEGRSPGGPAPRSCGPNWCRCRWLPGALDTIWAENVRRAPGRARPGV